MTLLALPTGAKSQVALGVQGGLGSFRVKGDAPDRFDYAGLRGGTAGLVLEWNVTDDLALSFQPTWTQKGARVTVEVKGKQEPVDSMELRLTYLSLPVLVKVATRSGRGFVTAGVDVGYLDAASLTVGDSPGIDVQDPLEPTDISALFGVGGTIRRGRPAITLEARYNQSIFRVLPASGTGGATSALPEGFRSSGFQLILGVLFPLGGGDR
jgi:hypothetical protein